MRAMGYNFLCVSLFLCGFRLFFLQQGTQGSLRTSWVYCANSLFCTKINSVGAPADYPRESVTGKLSPRSRLAVLGGADECVRPYIARNQPSLRQTDLPVRATGLECSCTDTHTIPCM